METQKIIWIALLLSLSLVAHAQDSVKAEGGNVTRVDIFLVNETERWQGFAGTIIFIGPDAPANVTATGGEVNGTTFNITSACTNPTSVTGTILFSNSSAIPVGLVSGNLSTLDTFVGTTEGDSGTATFYTTSTFNIGGNIPGVPTTFTHVNTAFQQTEFREGYLNDASGNLVFAVEVDLDTQGYNTSFFDFQAILPVFNRTDTPFFVTTDLDITCPGGRRPGGGGAGAPGVGQCIWSCGNWTTCQNGYQYRDCQLISACNYLIEPPLTRICADEPRKGQVITQDDLIRDIHDQDIIIEYPTELTAIAGDPFSVPITITNNAAFSVEDISATLNIPTTIQQTQPLHTNPLLYLFGTTPLATRDVPAIWLQLTNDHITIPPQQTRQLTIDYHTPLITPQTIPSTLTVHSGQVPLTTQPITIKTETPPFTIMHTKKEHTTNIHILIDNRGQHTQRIPLELNFNKGRSSVFTDYYTPRLPADQITIYHQAYARDYHYETVRARTRNLVAEVT